VKQVTANEYFWMAERFFIPDAVWNGDVCCYRTVLIILLLVIEIAANNNYRFWAKRPITSVVKAVDIADGCR
jgi:hypothetical protein